jgi:hypothetical protein
MYKEYLSDDIITFPEFANKTLYNIACDTSNTIKYRMNEHGYRSNSLMNEWVGHTRRGKIKILTLGCSWTMGLGVDNEKIWPTLIGNNYKTSVVCNYGMYGSSCEFLAKQYYKILQSGYIPDIVFVLWPGFSRRDYITESGRPKRICGWREAHPSDDTFENKSEDLAFLTLQNDYQDMNQFWNSYKFLNSATPDSVSVYHSVVGYYYEIFEQYYSIIKNFIDPKTFFIPKDCYLNDKKATDGVHPGIEWHNIFANKFYNFTKKELK